MTEIHSIRFRRLKAGSLFKLTLVLTAAVMIPFFTVCGIAAFFGARTVTVNHLYVTGVEGLLAALLMGPVFALVFSAIAWIGAYTVIRIIGTFRPFTLRYIPARPIGGNGTEMDRSGGRLAEPGSQAR